MSSEYYAKWWISTKAKLEHVHVYDERMAKMPAVKEMPLANHLIGGLFARYCTVLQDIDAIVDQMTQLQKSLTVRKLLNATAIRVNELKEELTKLDISEYHYIDGAMIELKLIPQLVEIIHPTIVYPRNPEHEAFWKALKRGDDIYVPPEPGSEAYNLEAEKTKKKAKKVKIDPMAMLNAAPQAKTAKPEVAPSPEPESPAPVSSDLQIGKSITRVMSLKQSASALRKEKRKLRPCNRPKSIFQSESEMTFEEKIEVAKNAKHQDAIKLIQAHERARQARLYIFDSCGGKVQRRKSTARSSKATQDATLVEKDPELLDKAATVIQRHWRGYLARKRCQYNELRRRLLIGMVEPSYVSQESKILMNAFLERRRDIRDQAMSDFLQAKIDEKARVLRVVAPGLFEDIGDEIRQWFKNWYYTCKAFKDIPSVAEGGTILVIRGDVESPQDHLAEMMKSGKKGKSKEKPGAKKDDKKKEKEKKKKGKDKGKKKRDEPYEFEPKRTQAMDDMIAGFTEYNTMWLGVDDIDNKPNMELITEEKCYEMQMEIRPQVDEVMRIELDMLKIAVEKDKWLSKKKKGAFKPKLGKGKGKKEKGGKGKKGKGKKDPTGNRKVEDLFQELYQSGIIRTYPEVHIADYPGDFSYQNWEQRERLQDPPATLSDARQAVIMNCIVPLGVEVMDRPKSVLITGPRECQLDILANGVFNDTRCVLFDLSAKNVVGKYPGKKGNKDLLNLVNKMSKILAPSIIYIEDVEKTFYKKVPKEEKKLDPKRVGKFLGKIVKAITPADRVLVLGTSYYPFLGQAAKLKKIFQRIILVPRSDYGSVYSYWHEVLMRYHAVDRNINLTSMSTLTKYYPLPQIKQAVEYVLDPERIIELTYRPLHHFELLDAILQGTGPVNDKEWEKYRKFYAGTKLAKERSKMLAALQKENAKK